MRAELSHIEMEGKGKELGLLTIMSQPQVDFGSLFHVKNQLSMED